MSDLIKLSVSKSGTFNSCKRKYQFAYIQKLPRKEWEYHLFGRFVHRILELFHLAYINGSTDSYSNVMSTAFNESMSEDEFKGKITQAAKDEAFEILTIYLTRLNNNKNEVAKVTSVEKKFNLEINDSLILTGMIDRIQLDEDGIHHVLDYKTSKSKTYLKDDTLQLLTYAYVIYQEHPELKKVRVSYIMLRHNCEFLTKEFTLDEILSVKGIYEKYAENIKKEVAFEPSPSKLCAYCDYVNLCDKGLQIVQNQYNHGKQGW
jgi:CRISPR/Cas system-associated exonuclease Cas4 (RecB family)